MVYIYNYSKLLEAIDDLLVVFPIGTWTWWKSSAAGVCLSAAAVERPRDIAQRFALVAQLCQENLAPVRLDFFSNLFQIALTAFDCF